MKKIKKDILPVSLSIVLLILAVGGGIYLLNQKNREIENREKGLLNVSESYKESVVENKELEKQLIEMAEVEEELEEEISSLERINDYKSDAIEEMRNSIARLTEERDVAESNLGAYVSGNVVTEYKIVFGEHVQEFNNDLISEKNKVTLVSSFEQKMESVFSHSFIDIEEEEYRYEESLRSILLVDDRLYYIITNDWGKYYAIGYLDLVKDESGYRPSEEGAKIIHIEQCQNYIENALISRDGNELLAYVNNRCCVIDMEKSAYQYTIVYEEDRTLLMTTDRETLVKIDNDYQVKVIGDGIEKTVFQGYYMVDDGSRGSGYYLEYPYNLKKSFGESYFSFNVGGYERDSGPYIIDKLGNIIYIVDNCASEYTTGDWLDDQQFCLFGWSTLRFYDFSKSESYIFDIDENVSFENIVYDNKGKPLIYGGESNQYKWYYFSGEVMGQYYELELPLQSYRSKQLCIDDNIYTLAIGEGILKFNNYSFKKESMDTLEYRSEPIQLLNEMTLIFPNIYGQANNGAIDLYARDEWWSDTLIPIGTRTLAPIESETSGILNWDIVYRDDSEEEMDLEDMLESRIMRYSSQVKYNSYTKEDKTRWLSIDRFNGTDLYDLEIGDKEVVHVETIQKLLRIYLLKWINQDTFEVEIIDIYLE